MKTRPLFRAATLVGILLVAAFAVLYGLTLDDGLRPGELEGGDLITHQYAQVQGRFSNAPGYPLYTLGGWLWFHAGRLLLGQNYNPIRILSSYSTLWALMALWLLYRLILEATKDGAGRRAAAGENWRGLGDEGIVSAAPSPDPLIPAILRADIHAGRGATAPAGENRHVPGTCEVPGTSTAIFRAVAHAGCGTTANENPSHGSRRSPDRRPARSGDRAKPEAIFRADGHAARGATVDENVTQRVSGLTSQPSFRRNLSEASVRHVQDRSPCKPATDSSLAACRNVTHGVNPLRVTTDRLFFRAVVHAERGATARVNGTRTSADERGGFSFSAFIRVHPRPVLRADIGDITVHEEAAAIVHRPLSIVVHKTDGNWVVAALVTAFYGVTYFFWYYAVTTEQYTSAVAWTLAVVFLAFRWERDRRDRYLLGLALLGGIGLAHMLTLLIIIPPLLWFVLRTDPKLLRRSRLIAGILALIALPLLSYAFVYIQGAQHPEWRGAGNWANTWQWFVSFLSTRQGRSELTWSFRPFFIGEFPSLIWGEMTWPGLVAGLLGVATLRGAALSAGSRRAVLIYATLALYLAFCWIDRLGNWFQVIMPAYALLAVGLGAGADWVWRRSQAVQGQRGRGAEERWRVMGRLVPGMLVIALAGLIVYRGAASLPRANSHGRAEDTGLVPAWAILADDPPPGTAILGTVGEALALNYLTEIWGERPDLCSVTSDQARDLLAQGSSLGVTEAALPLVPQEVSPDAHYSALGRTLIALSASPANELPETITGTEAGRLPLLPWAHAFGDALELRAGRIEPDAATGETVVLLVWHADARPAEDWAVSVRLTLGGAEIAQLDRTHPVHGAYPTTRWSPGEMVADAYPFKLPPETRPDGVTVILYRRLADGSFLNLGVARFALT